MANQETTFIVISRNPGLKEMSSEMIRGTAEHIKNLFAYSANSDHPVHPGSCPRSLIIVFALRITSKSRLYLSRVCKRIISIIIT